MMADSWAREFTAEFGKRVKERRSRQLISQERLAELSGVSKPRIISLERGQTQSAHPNTIRRLARALDIDIEGIINADIESTRLISSVRFHDILNSSIKRVSAISDFSEALARTPATQTRFVDYFHSLEDASWLGRDDLVQSLTIEIDEIWKDYSVAVPYEVWLLRYKKLGLKVCRLFVCELGRLHDPAYKMRFQEVLARHIELGLEPRYISSHETSNIQKSMDVACDAYVVVGSSFAMFVQLKFGARHAEGMESEPALLYTSNREVCLRSSNVFGQAWKNSRSYNDLQNKWGKLSKQSLRTVKSEVRVVEDAYAITFGST
jgi:transcriptional regulator with XRE-family HTH domain